ncbi:MAG: NADH:flavin oxidoreductase [Desulfobacterales bacterium]|nr:NADH:flavin oxidoreductase [Desulfobacterales bacterium]
MLNLFTTKMIGDIEIKNRFVHSATYECMADNNGEVTDKLIKRYSKLAKGGAGLIIPGYCYVIPNGRAMNYQTGIHNDKMIAGLTKLVDVIHTEGSKIAFQLAHSGRQTTKDTIGQTQIAPSKGSMDTIYMAKPKEMKEKDIQEVIKAFGAAASRADKSGADGVQIHAAHGYLVNQFLSPFFNKRSDSWGGSDQNRFKFIKEIILEVKKNVSEDMMILVKLNTQDFTPKERITLELAKKYSEWLAELPLDGLEISCGTLSYSMFNMVRGGVPTEEIIMNFPWWRKKIGKIMLKKMEGKFDLEEGYNLEGAKLIKPVIGKIPLMVVGGLRKVTQMEEVIGNGVADFISMSRPFIREPNIVNRIKNGKAGAVSCISCNKCFAGVANYLPVNCYTKGFPKKPEEGI